MDPSEAYPLSGHNDTLLRLHGYKGPPGLYNQPGQPGGPGYDDAEEIAAAVAKVHTDPRRCRELLK